MGSERFGLLMNTLALGIGNLGGPDLIIILLIVLVLFGAKKLPDLAGQSMNEFRKAREDVERELHNTGPSQPQPSQSTQLAGEPNAQQAKPAARAS